MLGDLCLPNSNDGYEPKGDTCHKCGQVSHTKGGVQISHTKFVCVKCWRFAAVTKNNPKKTKGAS